MNRYTASAVAALSAVAGLASAQEQAIQLTPGLTHTHVYGPHGFCSPAVASQDAWIQANIGPAALAMTERIPASVGRLGNPANTRATGLDVQYNLSSAVAANTEFVAALELAAQTWEAVINDEITVVMSVGFTSGAGFIAAAGSSSATAPYATFRNALIADASAEEAALVGSLPAAPLDFDYGGFIYTPGISQSEDITNINTALVPALGFNDVNSGSDASITFNTDFPFDNDPTTPLEPGAVDVVYVMTHELGHALGFVSGTDGPNFPSVWDYFRTGGEGAANDADDLAQWASVDRVMSQGGNAALDAVGSIAGLAENNFRLSTGTGAGGDGRQASHWKDQSLLPQTNVIGVMDPTFEGGAGIDTLNILSDADLVAFSLMGYDIDFPFAPSSTPCSPADLLEPFGVLDLSDVQLFLIAFGNQDPEADLVVDGVYDLLDVQTFLIAFGAGCP